MPAPSFRETEPVAWTFHRNTCVGPFQSSADPVSEAPQPPKEYVHAPLVRLPRPQLPGARLDRVLAERASCRRFVDADLEVPELSALLGGAYGVLGRARFEETMLMERPVPSGGGMYPLEVYLLARRVAGLDPAIYHYAPLHHGLERLTEGPAPATSVSRLFLDQPWAGGASVVVVLTAVLDRTLRKYHDRGYRYVLFEAGHVAQNLNLVATGAGLGSCNFGGFADHHLAGLLGIDVEVEVPLYAIAIGRPASADRNEGRAGPE